MGGYCILFTDKFLGATVGSFHLSVVMLKYSAGSLSTEGPKSLPMGFLTIGISTQSRDNALHDQGKVTAINRQGKPCRHAIRSGIAN